MTMLMLACCLPLWLAAAVLYTDTFSLPFIAMGAGSGAPRKGRGESPCPVCASARCSLVVLIGCQIKMTALIALIAAANRLAADEKPRQSVVCAL